MHSTIQRSTSAFTARLSPYSSPTSVGAGLCGEGATGGLTGWGGAGLCGATGGDGTLLSHAPRGRRIGAAQNRALEAQGLRLQEPISILQASDEMPQRLHQRLQIRHTLFHLDHSIVIMRLAS